MANYLENAVERLVAMWNECITAVTSTSALRAVSSDPMFFGDAFPYVVISPGVYVPDATNQDFSDRPYLFQMAYIIGHVTEGYSGEPAERFFKDEPTILKYFMARRKLQCTGFTAVLNDLAPKGCEFRRSAGFGVVRRSGDGVQCVGTVFDLLVPFNITVTPAF